MVDAFCRSVYYWRALVSRQVNSLHGVHHKHKYMVYNMNNEL